MKKASILIPNRNSFEAIQLCIESIRHYTRYPYKIIVYDDYSYYPQNNIIKENPIDLTYLRECQRKGWIKLIEGKPHARHGGALNTLVNDVCDTDYAVICDCDIQIRGYGWLEDFCSIAKKDASILTICNQKKAGYTIQGYRSGMFTLWFGFLNMQNYRDGMQVDWNVKYGDRRESPYTEEVAEIHPADRNALFQHYLRQKNWDRSKFDINKVCNDPGSMLYLKWKFDNPKGFKAVPIPTYIEAKYRHWSHISLLPYPSPLLKDEDLARKNRIFGMIKEELRKLRC